METENGYIRLDQFLKLRGLVDSGGQAKFVIQSGNVLVNGEVDTRRGKKLRIGDKVTYNGEDLQTEPSDIK